MYSKEAVQTLLKAVSRNQISAEKAYQRLKHISYETLGFAKVDHHRPLRKNLPEVVYAPGKTQSQLEKIVSTLLRKKQPLLVTRLEEAQFKKLKKRFSGLSYSKLARAAYTQTKRGQVKYPNRLPVPFLKNGKYHSADVAIVTAGTSDIPVAEEAKITLETLGRKVSTFYDLGVAGLHRLLDYIEEIERAEVVICIAGMEGALVSVLAGLISKPIVAVPTSIGYGASFKGIAPLLTMLSTCAQGVAVVNVDSGFNAACFAHLIVGK